MKVVSRFCVVPLLIGLAFWLGWELSWRRTVQSSGMHVAPLALSSTKIFEYKVDPRIAAIPQEEERNRTEPLKSNVFRERIERFRGSKLKYVEENGQLSEAGAFVLALDDSQRSLANQYLSGLLDTVHQMQKESIKSVSTSEAEQTFEIADFSVGAASKMKDAASSLASLIGEERSQLLFAGIKESHSDLFCGFGQGRLQVTFLTPNATTMNVVEEKLSPDGSVYSKKAYGTADIPLRYKRVLVVK